MSDAREQAIEIARKVPQGAGRDPHTGRLLLRPWPEVAEDVADGFLAAGWRPPEPAEPSDETVANGVVRGAIRLRNKVREAIMAGLIDSRSAIGDACLDLHQSLERYRDAGYAPRAFAVPVSAPEAGKP